MAARVAWWRRRRGAVAARASGGVRRGRQRAVAVGAVARPGRHGDADVTQGARAVRPRPARRRALPADRPDAVRLRGGRRHGRLPSSRLPPSLRLARRLTRVCLYTCSLAQKNFVTSPHPLPTGQRLYR